MAERVYGVRDHWMTGGRTEAQIGPPPTNDISVLTIQFMPAKVNGQWSYSPPRL
jgi:hypothetical protein